MSGSEVDLQKLLRFSVQLAREAGAQIKEASEKRWTAGGGLEEKMNSVDLVRPLVLEASRSCLFFWPLTTLSWTPSGHGEPRLISLGRSWLAVYRLRSSIVLCARWPTGNGSSRREAGHRSHFRRIPGPQLHWRGKLCRWSLPNAHGQAYLGVLCVESSSQFDFVAEFSRGP